MDKSDNELMRDTLYIGALQDDGMIYRFGTLSLVCESDGRTIYEYDFDKERFESALEIAGENMLPGFNPEHGYFQRHDKEISFVYERTFHRKREDLEECLAPWGMHAKDYNPWELIKRTRGLHFRDKWRVTPFIKETV